MQVVERPPETTLERPRVNGQPPGRGFELYAWYFMRVSGLLLVFLALGHLAIMHIINNVDVITYEWVAARWSLPLWRLYDLLLLWLALLHGLNGVRVVIDDYIHTPGWRLFALTSLAVIGFVLLVVGSEVILSFQPGMFRA
jgi:succinate dehydrogenase / fumarate reductase membrane anchor subunit